MAQTIQVRVKDGSQDALGEKVKSGIIKDLGIPVEDVRTYSVYTIDDGAAPLSPEKLNELAEQLFSDPVVNSTIPISAGDNFDWLLEVGKKPGVNDPEGRTSAGAAEDVLKKISGETKENSPEIIYQIYTSKKYAITGNDIQKKDVERIA